MCDYIYSIYNCIYIYTFTHACIRTKAISHFFDSSIPNMFQKRSDSGLGCAQFGPAGAVVVQGALLHCFAQGGIWVHRAGLEVGPLGAR